MLEVHFVTAGVLMNELCYSPNFGIVPFIVLKNEEQTGK